MKLLARPDYQYLCPFIYGLPQTFDGEGRLLFAGRNEIRLFTILGTDVVVKRYRRPRFVQRLVYTFFRSSKARRAFLSAGELQARGIDTPVGMAYAETHRFGLLEYAYYLSGVDDAPAIRGPLIEAESFDRVMAEDFARFAARLHRQGVLHGDLNSTNVLYHSQADGHYTFSVIDINRMRFYDGEPPLDACMENLTRFCPFGPLFRFVAEAYVWERRLPASAVDTLIQVKLRHDARWRRRKAFLKLFK